MSLNLCNWRDNTWLGSTVESIERVCRQYTDESEAGTREQHPKETLWIGWLDEYNTGDSASQLAKQYLNLRRQDPIKGCGGRTRSMNINTWEKLVTDVLDKIQNVKELRYACRQKDTNQEGLRYDKAPNWKDLLCRRCWPETEGSRAILGALTCIIARLAQPTENNNNKGMDTPDPCRDVLRELRVGESDWAPWLTTAPSPPLTDCPDTPGEERKREAEQSKISLVLSIYGALRELCPTCGPYHLTPWIAPTPGDFLPQGNLYCLLNEKNLNCSSQLNQRQINTSYLLYRGKTISRKNNSQTHTPPDTRKQSPGGERETQPQGTSIQAQSHRTISNQQTTASNQKSMPQDIPKEQKTTERGENGSRDDPPGKSFKNDSEGLMGLNSASSPPRVGDPRDQLSSRVSSGPVMSQIEPPQLPKAVSETEGRNRTSHQKLTAEVFNSSPKVIGGVITALILGSLSMYGAWRIRYGKRRNPEPKSSRIKILVKYPSSGNTLADTEEEPRGEGNN
ncbi:hypothetical protein C922_05540 [Plasmodium inui San Antonio 1]|uniref:Uncharacterized protein n=1 Tax=Plasmodium inui San Antonio 1 TaxID=1237626 RepID=W6ZT48_9APIC|nr:hypothetical protein C922_05540 [Plasmodium inui San Antonio 1]EUD64077.1 hypothetical protein C922_05540 [Plasmodium inui San Antonio 1]